MFIFQELLSAIAGFITVCEAQFISIAHQLLEEEALNASQSECGFAIDLWLYGFCKSRLLCEN